ncbi:glycoside hydrolase family 24 protein [Massilia timonae]|uniref:glycoside hydrolase family 24 protein n=1 Tax=Massilia timonae TaxID=47229 RepID=UPI0028D612D9|nr:glycoside hydrolase family 104 protein [Massilia timonae]
MMDKRLIVVALAALAAWMLMQEQAGADGDRPDYEAPDLLDEATALWDDITDFSGGAMTPWEQQNVQAFLRTIRTAEGTAGGNGYSMLFGGDTFTGFADHPRVKITRTSNGRPITSSAAGAYQMLARTWDGVRAKLGLADFSPASQDRAAVELIRQRGALADVRAGRFADAINKCRKEWASLPGAGYGQPEKNVGDLFTAYINAGGNVA